MTWPFVRTLRTSDPGGTRRLYGLCEMESLGVLACSCGDRSRRYRRLWPHRGRLRLLASFRQSSWLLFLTRRASCSDVLCLGLNPNYSSRISQRMFPSCKILANKIFSNNLQIVSRSLMDLWDDGSFPSMSIEITRACFHAVEK